MKKKASKPLGPWRDLARVTLLLPLWALPFALFFVLVLGAKFSAFWLYYQVSLVFTTFALLSVWFTKHWLERRVMGAARLPVNRTLAVAGTYMFMAVFGTMAAALFLNLAVVPGFLGGARGVLTVLVYCLLFGTLFLGISIALSYHKEAMERAGSERELQLARRIQRSFLLSEFPQRSRVEVHAVNVSSKEVSGDFYDVVPAGEEDVLLAIADVSGKGVPAALLSSMLQASVRTQATFFLAILHEPTLTLRFTNAGHNYPVLLRANGERVLLEKGGCVIGMLEGPEFEEATVALAPGDRIVFYTDGVSEAEREGGEMFGEERLYALLDTAPRDLPAERLVEHVLGGVRGWLNGVEPGDDITVMALRVLEPGAVRA